MTKIQKLVLIILACLFIYYVYPTPYKEMKPMKQHFYSPFRMHRITGVGETFMRGKWRKIEVR